MNRITRLLKRKAGLLHVKLADLAGASAVPGMIATIASGDGMYLGDNAAYFEVGYSALRCIRLALLTAEKDNVERILDFGCGHGRVLRTLKAAFPAASLTACDINRGGVDFCAETFGAVPVYSAARPADIHLPQSYDLIWCGSVFSHLSEARWPAFLDLLFSHLGLNGVAVLTTCGRTIADRLRTGDPFYGLDPAQTVEILRGFDEGGFGFARQSSGTLDDWGLSLTSPSCVLAHLAKFPEMELLSFTERGWSRHLDVVSLVKTGSGQG